MDSPNSSSTKLDVYQIVTDKIISLLEQGVVPWQKPWADAGIPMNLMSKRPYRGINLWMLVSLNYEKNLFLTWDQIKAVGGSVLKGEQGHIVVFWKPIQKKQDTEVADKQKQVPMLRYYKVFNVSQCRDIPPHLIPEQDVRQEFDAIAECEGIIQTMPDCPAIEHKEPDAFYNIETDVINMPKKRSFKAKELYYATLFHELVHSTGAAKRLVRSSVTDMVPFGTASYAMEELIAEIGSAFLCRFTGILPPVISNTVSYIDNWLGVFKKDKRFLITAAGQAQKAVDMILGRKDNEAKDEVEESEGESVVS